mmetsp:Transcript_65775/g.176226  ORF Transcript_65775/g.176226 Transcript_65775/m.176226 type:complete len:431 (-) Transcript_65775:49-1341(-)
MISFTDRIFLAHERDRKLFTSDMLVFTKTFKYDPYCDDFGPLNLSCVYRFCETLIRKMKAGQGKIVVYQVEDGIRNFTNGAFLVGAYMILVEQVPPENIWKKFAESKAKSEPYRDATFVNDQFGLTLLDCWKALAKVKGLGWISANEGEGRYDIDEYEHYDSPLNGEFQEIVPDKFVAFRGPDTLPGDEYYEDIGGRRVFSAHYYADVLHDFGVAAVIRLNDSDYDPDIFRRNGIEHYDLIFDDCTAPPQPLVTRFLDIVDSHSARSGRKSSGDEREGHAIAVHCFAGLGRTGTLVALYLMLEYRFAAREAIGWLRVVRPGSVIGDQQRYLAEVEVRLRTSGHYPTTAPPIPCPFPAAGDLKELPTSFLPPRAGKLALSSSPPGGSHCLAAPLPSMWRDRPAFTPMAAADADVRAHQLRQAVLARQLHLS